MDNRLTKAQILEIAEKSRQMVESPELEKILQAQEDLSLKTPGVEAHYYRFFYRLAQAMNPKVILELGTHTGISAACLAEGAPKARVITVNNHNEIKEENHRGNVEYRIHDSLEKIDIPEGIDILFLDTWHDGIRCANEYRLYEANVNPGGLILFDDVYLFDCMKNFWGNFSPIRGEKFEIPVHGWVGFGVVLLGQERPIEAQKGVV
jgi:predicted O-methyltransferase YrrM